MDRLCFFLAVLIFASPAWPAETQVAPPTFAIPFDDFDEATLQAEVSKQVLAFLETLRGHWGENAATLRAVVIGSIRDDEQGKLVYLRNIGEHGVLEGYEFRLDLLVRGQYIVLQRPLNSLNEFIGYYQAVKRTLTERFGAPSQDRVVWDNDLYQPVPDYWGVAVMMGFLHYHAMWHTQDGLLTLDLTGNHHSKLTINYYSKGFLSPERVASTRTN
jgi:hypothetical protein